MPPPVVPDVARTRPGWIEVTCNRIEFHIHDIGVVVRRHPVDDALPLLLLHILPLRVFAQIVQIVSEVEEELIVIVADQLYLVCASLMP